MPTTSDEIQALRNFKSNIKDFMSEELSRYRSEYIDDKTLPSKEELKQNLRQYFNSEINQYLIASGISSKFHSREEYEKLKQEFIKTNPGNDTELEQKIDGIVAPYLKCLDNLDKEIDKASAAIIKSVVDEQKTDKIIKGVCIALGVIAVGVAAFFTAGAILGIPAIVATAYSVALACAGSGVISAVKSGLSSSSTQGMFTSLLQSVGIMQKDDVEFDNKTLNRLTTGISHQIKMLPQENNIEELRKRVAEITTPLSPDAIKHIPSKSHESAKQSFRAGTSRSRHTNEASEELTPEEISSIKEMGKEMKKADKKVRDITLKQKRVALKHERTHSKFRHKAMTTLDNSSSLRPTLTPTAPKSKNHTLRTQSLSRV